MIIISPLFDFYFNAKLKSKKYRKKVFKKAIDKKLRKTKLGRILLRNIFEQMQQLPLLHDEFMELVDVREHQKIFWESDLGFFWLNGNFQAKRNTYFELAINNIKSN